jgi:hypothetical protein
MLSTTNKESCVEKMTCHIVPCKKECGTLIKKDKLDYGRERRAVERTKQIRKWGCTSD